MLPIVPPLVLFLAKHPLVDSYKLDTLEDVLCGGAPVGEELLIYLFIIYLLFSHNKDYTSITLYKDVARGPQKTTRLVRGGPLGALRKRFPHIKHVRQGM